ncbi:hypothetical protein HOK51_07140 [Candidatus Woesearchaeota archaeon]|jgi:hypothetical protein|nr:hypothetical protein [Candidatus Woesearchaeota archaeon]MBT6519596.1 hypothetical protein [Candidatus Woesearchaeota archaeon]MBT7367511.1 hypothetical protein [Candidatus Woesearchaeota archaeon]
MKIKDILDKLYEHSEFKEWKKDHLDHYLAHIFFINENNSLSFDIGFYSEAKNRMTTFLLTTNDIQIKPDQEIFKDPNHKLESLNSEDVKVEYAQAIDTALEFQKKEYPSDPTMKEIVILQHLHEVGLVWNITFVTQTVKTLNIKVSADDAKIKEHKINSLMDMTAK